MSESALLYGKYMFFGRPNPPKGWVTVRPNSHIVHNDVLIEKFYPQQPQLSKEEYEQALGKFPY